MAAPALAVMGRGEQPIDQPLVRVGSGVGQEGGDIARRGGKSDQIEVEAADERPLLGVGRESKAFPPHGIEQKGVDRRADAIARGGRGRFRPVNGAKGPIVAILVGDDAAGSDVGRLAVSGGSTGGDPRLDGGDLGRGNFLFARRHFARLEPIEQVTLRRDGRE